MDNETSAAANLAGLGRRRVLKATAWSVPVIAVAMAAPAAAASPGTAVVLNLAQTGVTTQAVAAQNIDRTLIRSVTASSEQTGEGSAFANDESLTSFWHTKWSVPAAVAPHFITFEAPADREVTALRYKPRPAVTGDSGSLNGVANGYSVVGSATGVFATADSVQLASGSWTSVTPGYLTAREQQTATFTAPSRVRYFRLNIISHHGNGGVSAFGSAADIRLVGAPVDPVTAFRGTATFVAGNKPVTQATMKLTVPATGLNAATAPTVSGAGWSQAGLPTVSGTNLIFTFNFADMVSPGGTSSILTYSLAGNGATPKAQTTPKTANGVITMNQGQVATSQVIWN